MRAWIAVSLISSSLVAVSLLPAGGVRGAMGSRVASDMLTLRGELAHSPSDMAAHVTLPPEAVAVIEARGGMMADAPVIMRLNLPLNGHQAPVPFSLSIPRERLDPRGALYLRGGVSVRGRPVWTTAAVRLEPARNEQELGVLRLTQAGADAFITRVQASNAEIATLEGDPWTVTAIGDDDIPAADRPVTIRFGADGSVSGQGPCNGFRGTYRVTEGRLALSQIASTLMACAPAMTARERSFLETLREIGDFETPGEGLLVLRTPDGRTLEAMR